MAAVSYQRVADYERRRVRAQPDYGVGDLVGLADASDRLFRGDPIPFSDLPPVKGFLADAASAGLRVGYEDPLYFSREYKKYFGDPRPRAISPNLALTRSLELAEKSAPPRKRKLVIAFMSLPSG